MAKLLKVKLSVKRADGRPLPPDTELALAAVDEALLESFAELLLGQRSDFTKFRLAPGVR